MIKLRRLNVVKEVGSEDKAKRLEEIGFKRVLETKEPSAAEKKEVAEEVEKEKKATKRGKGKNEEGEDDNESGSDNENSNGGNGQP